MFDYIVGVFRLNPNTFEEIEQSESATRQAAIIMACVALLQALSNGFISVRSEEQFLTGYFLTSLVWSFASWYVWAALVSKIGTTFFGSKASVQEMLRVIGFANIPRLLAIIPAIGGPIGVIWSLIAGFVGVRQSLKLDNLKAALTITIGFAIYIAGGLLLGFLVGRAGLFSGI